MREVRARKRLTRKKGSNGNKIEEKRIGKGVLSTPSKDDDTIPDLPKWRYPTITCNKDDMTMSTISRSLGDVYIGPRDNVSLREEDFSNQGIDEANEKSASSLPVSIALDETPLQGDEVSFSQTVYHSVTSAKLIEALKKERMEYLASIGLLSKREMKKFEKEELAKTENTRDHAKETKSPGRGASTKKSNAHGRRSRRRGERRQDDWKTGKNLSDSEGFVESYTKDLSTIFECGKD